MKTISRFEEVIGQSFDISSPYLLATALEQIKQEKENLLTELKDNSCIKVPIVGDFSAGKSSLLNSFIGRNSLLPVDITPETAVAYELYYSGDNEYVELYREGKKIDERPVDEIKKLSVKPGDIAKVFIASPKIQDLQNRGITLVDMPGIDSGIKEHNDAILHYITRGTAFILLVDVGQGSLRQSTLAFMTELSKYNLKPAVLISKVDKKPASELKDIKEYISFQATKAIGSDTFVGCISAHNNDINDFVQYLATIDTDKLISERFRARVVGYVNLQIACLSTQLDLANVNLQNIEEKIGQLEEEKARIAERLATTVAADKPEKSTQDILDDVSEELTAHSEEIAQMIVNKEGSDNIQALILNYIRPVIINSFKEEGEQYAASLNTVVDDATKTLQDTLKIEGNVIDNVMDSFHDEIAGGLSVAADFLINNPNIFMKALGYILMFFGDKIPELIRFLFGKSKESIVLEMVQKINAEINPKIIEQLRKPIFELVVMQQTKIRENIQKNITNGLGHLQDTMRVVGAETSKEELDAKIANLQTAINQLKEFENKI